MQSIDSMRDSLASVGYLAGESASLVAFLAGKLGKPVLVEGPAGVGKTELAKALSRATRIFGVSVSLKRHAVSLGVAADKIVVVGNGVDTVKFHRLARRAARCRR